MTERDRPPLEQQLVSAIEALEGGPAFGGTPADDAATLDRLEVLFDAQVASRQCDLVARWLRGRGKGYYTIGSSGHESNAAVALALAPRDPALLHYRSGGFYMARAGLGGIDDILAGVCAASDEPIAGGRHKVIGRHDLAIVPQTSTIASHLPRAVGVAFAIGRAARLNLESPWPDDALAVCSFGDASANHSTSAGAINTALHCAHQRLPLPLLFVCEDNGLGISVRTPSGWIESAYGHRPHLRYVAVDGHDPVAVLAAVDELSAWIRHTRRPAFLHLRTVRFGGHAGTDVEAAYRSQAEIRADAVLDPIVGTAAALVHGGRRSVGQLLQRHDEIREVAYASGTAASGRPQLSTAAEVVRPLAPRRPDRVALTASTLSATDRGLAPMTLAQAVNSALADVLEARPEAVLFGEDVAAKGGVYGVTKGLLARVGAARVFDTLLDETSILGLAAGSAISGLLPLAEIQYLAYLHNAEDQLRGEAATLSFFSNGQYRNGMLVRIAGLGYQEGFGGHFHNDDSLTVLRDIPGLVVGVPARPDDAAAMVRTMVAAAHEDGSVCVMVEPIARYHTTDLHEPGDGLWAASPDPTTHVAIGLSRTYEPVAGDGPGDLTVLTFGNGLFMSLRVARRLAGEGIRVRVVDLRWIAPLPVDDIVREARATGRVLVVDETRRSGGVAEGVMAALLDAGFTGPVARVASKDSFIPLGDAARLVLLSEAEIEEGVRAVLAR